MSRAGTTDYEDKWLTYFELKATNDSIPQTLLSNDLAALVSNGSDPATHWRTATARIAATVTGREFASAKPSKSEDGTGAKIYAQGALDLLRDYVALNELGTGSDRLRKFVTTFRHPRRHHRDALFPLLFDTTGPVVTMTTARDDDDAPLAAMVLDNNVVELRAHISIEKLLFLAMATAGANLPPDCQGALPDTSSLKRRVRFMQNVVFAPEGTGIRGVLDKERAAMREKDRVNRDVIEDARIYAASLDTSTKATDFIPKIHTILMLEADIATKNSGTTTADTVDTALTTTLTVARENAVAALKADERLALNRARRTTPLTPQQKDAFLAPFRKYSSGASARTRGTARAVVSAIASATHSVVSEVDGDAAAGSSPTKRVNKAGVINVALREITSDANASATSILQQFIYALMDKTTGKLPDLSIGTDLANALNTACNNVGLNFNELKQLPDIVTHYRHTHPILNPDNRHFRDVIATDEGGHPFGAGMMGGAGGARGAGGQGY